MAANNVETVMKPLGKAMKIGMNNLASETDTLQSFLQSFLLTYRDTPHPPGNMIFRDGYRSDFPQRSLSADRIIQPQRLDASLKEKRKAVYNSSTHTKAAALGQNRFGLHPLPPMQCFCLKLTYLRVSAWFECATTIPRRSHWQCSIISLKNPTLHWGRGRGGMVYQRIRGS